jgi:predicted RNA-binding Zn ribbon-like protein
MVDAAESYELASTVDLVGGRLCLDYVNTIGWRAGVDADDQEEALRTYGDLVAWARHASALAVDEAERLRAESTRRPIEAAAALTQAIALRETLYRLFMAVLRGQAAGSDELAAFNESLARTLAQARIASDAGGYTWTWSGEGDELDRMLWPVVRSTAEMLTSATELGQIRVCAGERCDWLFLDTSRNHRRRWCRMDACGNRAKARRHYQRQRAGEAR